MLIATIKFPNGENKDIVTHTKALTEDKMVERIYQVWGHIGEMEIEIETV
jgi:hypothetical protein